mmetsp:Transcript_108047/g.312215  ORF Transcript_108047/g.312215 Transcript_108047/m.312215 type:complete len:693 (-) Transcript_108047:101-2179(-)
MCATGAGSGGGGSCCFDICGSSSAGGGRRAAAWAPAVQICGFSCAGVAVALALAVTSWMRCFERSERLARNEFVQERRLRAQESQLLVESALASGMRAIAERLCDLVFRLDDSLRFCTHSVSVDAFFGKPMFGESISSSMSVEDFQRVSTNCKDAIRSAVPQLLPVTISCASERKVEAHLLITDTGMRMNRFIVGLSMNSSEETFSPATTAGPDFHSYRLSELRTDKGVASEAGTLDTAAIFDQQELVKVADLGRKEHWWIEASDLEALTPMRILGEGGFGIVIVARLHGQTVAAKTLRDPDGRGARRLGSFCSEIRAIRRARHPHIAAFLGAASSDEIGSVTLVYDLIVGSRLDDFARSAARSDQERFQVAFQTCTAICYLHAQRPAIVHGDLKPGNVIVEQRPGPHVRLIDFGLSRIISPTAANLGVSLAWASPEVVLGRRQPSTSVDVFGFGWLLYVAMTGGLPYGGAAPEALKEAMRETIEAQAIPPLPMPADAPWQEETDGLCRQCLQFGPEDRPGIDAVLTSLKEWGKARHIAQRLDISTASAMLEEVEWHKVASELQCRTRLMTHGCEEVQVDFCINDAGALQVTNVTGEAPFIGQDAIGVDLCRYTCRPEGLRVSICSMLEDVRRGARQTPLFQELAGVEFHHSDGGGRVLPVRLRAFVPDVSGVMSVKLGWHPGEIRVPRLSL